LRRAIAFEMDPPSRRTEFIGKLRHARPQPMKDAHSGGGARVRANFRCVVVPFVCRSFLNGGQRQNPNTIALEVARRISGLLHSGSGIEISRCPFTAFRALARKDKCFARKDKRLGMSHSPRAIALDNFATGIKISLEGVPRRIRRALVCHTQSGCIKPYSSLCCVLCPASSPGL
jgi:hypothetical protein